MLPSNLLVARVRWGRVEPLLLKPEGLPLAIAEEILSRIKSGVGKSESDLMAEFEDLEELALESGMDLRVVRAMAAIALRESRFERVKTTLDPVRARLEIFEEAGTMCGIAVREDERKEVLRRVSERLGCSVEELEKILTKHMVEELVEPAQLTAEELVKEYNLSMVQTLLFKALRLEVLFKSDGATAKRLLRAVKSLGLLYIAEQAGDGVRLTIDGPASLLRQTRRYGTRLAKLVPYIMRADRWDIRADIGGRRRVLKFELNDSKAELFPLKEVELEPVFDSEVEREFFKSLSALSPAWVVRREPEPLVVGGRIFIPDFSVSCGGKNVYIEVVGFWTKEYLEKKLQKLREVRGINLIVAVDEELACSSIENLPHDVVLFRRRLRGADVYPILKRYLGVPPPRVGQPTPQFDLEQIKSALPDLDGMTLEEVAKLLEERGVERSAATEVVERLGYRVEWRSLDPSRAVVKRE
ncbi:MAG: DUF790 family protein [Thermofilaceae archaeon]